MSHSHRKQVVITDMLGLSETSVSTNSVAWTLNVGTLLGGEANICVYIHMYIYIYLYIHIHKDIVEYFSLFPLYREDFPFDS